MRRTTVVSRRGCALCKRLTPVTELILLELDWGNDLVWEQLLCAACRWEVPVEILQDVPHVWRAVA